MVKIVKKYFIYDILVLECSDQKIIRYQIYQIDLYYLVYLLPIRTVLVLNYNECSEQSLHCSLDEKRHFLSLLLASTIIISVYTWQKIYSTILFTINVLSLTKKLYKCVYCILWKLIALSQSAIMYFWNSSHFSD